VIEKYIASGFNAGEVDMATSMESPYPSVFIQRRHDFDWKTMVRTSLLIISLMLYLYFKKKKKFFFDKSPKYKDVFNIIKHTPTSQINSVISQFKT
jgi:hypothetical protein